MLRCIKKECAATCRSRASLVAAGWGIFKNADGREIFLCPKHLASEKTKGLN